MRIKQVVVHGVVAAGFGLLLAVPAWAHHAFGAEYDRDKPVKLEGTITKMEWVNPHAWIYLDVKGPDGKIVNSAIETGAPNAMFRRGWRKDSLKPGTEVVVNGYQAKNGAPMANGSFVQANGQKLFVGSSGTGAPDEGP